ncbi:DNA replication complex GINS protein PSF1 [Tribolium castaneum]|uniref:DNA replication complex GINS protein PSF1 n=1 Tax=Tribolium castaneum TaxID=7070 RepID=D7EIS4_TRICA|nr:PREDICTED: DNA replication complex GINS protein PSF1 [Tribolium castaneum]EFA12251.1 DNA replication complex GINS protein PSF1-like Protein [Tribolium castaneum]|eukprot:XP_967779.1 PREDICTED: DNA replication complex GINS protein PSF1 [Tribolium castaneum]
MFCEKAHVLIKELSRNRDALPPYNTDLLNEINTEVKQLITQNQEDAQISEDSRVMNHASYLPTVKIRHAAIKRNIRCILAYHYNRLKCLRNMRWQFGSILPPDVKSNLSQSEIEWFSKYSSNLVQYMRSIGDEGINLAVDLKPPKSLYIEVRCLTDYGQFELNDGSVLLLKENSRHYLPRSECEELIRQGVLEHVV